MIIFKFKLIILNCKNFLIYSAIFNFVFDEKINKKQRRFETSRKTTLGLLFQFSLGF